MNTDPRYYTPTRLGSHRHWWTNFNRPQYDLYRVLIALTGNQGELVISRKPMHPTICSFDSSKMFSVWSREYTVNKATEFFEAFSEIMEYTRRGVGHRGQFRCFPMKWKPSLPPSMKHCAWYSNFAREQLPLVRLAIQISGMRGKMVIRRKAWGKNREGPQDFAVYGLEGVDFRPLNDSTEFLYRLCKKYSGKNMFDLFKK